MKTPGTADSKLAKKRKQWPRVRHVEGRVRPWMVDARINGKGERFFFETATEADAKADLLRVDRKNTGDEGASIPAKLRADAIEAQQRLAAVGASLMDAVDYYLAHARPAGGERTVAQVVTEFIQAKRNAGRKDTYLEIQTYVLANVFGGAFGARKVHEITAAEVDAWMNGKPWTMRTRLNYFADIRNLFGFAVRKGYRPTNPMQTLDKPTVIAASPGVLTVEQAGALLTACASGEGEMLPAVALGLFAGLRTSELEAIQWEHIHLGERNIHVAPEVAKRIRGLIERDVEISDTLLAWLTRYAKRSGPVAPQKSFDYRLAQKAEAAGITEWPKNALRHSFASYHLKHFKNAPLTASQLGHQGSTQTLFLKYQKRVTPADAARYWQLKPSADASAKVVSISAAA